MEQQRLYLNEHCAQCGARACVTEREEFWLQSKLPICPEAPSGEMHCRGACCHGCECAQRDDCPVGCDCDCHMETLPLTRDPRPQPPPEPLDPRRCRCRICHHGIPPTLEHVAGYAGDSEGYWVSNRPRDCLKFEGRLRDGRCVISSCYDNADGRNQRVDSYFYRITVSDAQQ